ncbi:hypothetical protein RAS12_30965 (plasmid) [Achromobacter seleniivolatilans]|uniref:Uncharacterized protein n=1 Tax=Achromobacter seleniivolatilans TaxID=3047478 RepID=A0ABY9MAN4_9BURK|nr:hypothetical protein [Achromobacter sp. R39]WMD24056.1 hypothetical protein RAS12_30965 [Achromobacter sp. R39]
MITVGSLILLGVLLGLFYSGPIEVRARAWVTDVPMIFLWLAWCATLGRAAVFFRDVARWSAADGMEDGKEVAPPPLRTMIITLWLAGAWTIAVVYAIPAIRANF